MTQTLQLTDNTLKFNNRNSIGLVGKQNNFSIDIKNVDKVGYLTTWIWDDDEEVIFIISSNRQKFIINLKLLSNSDLMTLKNCFGSQFITSLADIRQNSPTETITLLYCKDSSELLRATTIKWTLVDRFKGLLYSFILQNPLQTLVKT